jgi:hypothetical protein
MVGEELPSDLVNLCIEKLGRSLLQRGLLTDGSIYASGRGVPPAAWQLAAGSVRRIRTRRANLS